MQVTIHGDVNGTIIDTVQQGALVVGYTAKAVDLGLNNEDQKNELKDALEKLREHLCKESPSSTACEQVNDALDAINRKDESKLLQALKAISRECVNLAEGVLGSILATLIMQG